MTVYVQQCGPACHMCLCLCVTVLCFIIMVHNGASSSLRVGRLYRALFLLGLALCPPRASVSLVFMVLYIYVYIFLKNTLHLSLYLLVS